MIKDFDGWNEVKKTINNSKITLNFHEGEIWNCLLGVNIGHELDGKKDFLRPVVIVKKVNIHGFIGVPLSTQPQSFPEWTYTAFPFDGKIAHAIVTQVRYFDISRTKYRMGKINNYQLYNIKQKIKGMF